MVDIYLDESDTRRLIKEKLAKDNAPNLINSVISNQQHTNHYNKVELQQAIEYLSSVLVNSEDILEQKNIPKMLQLTTLLFLNGELDYCYSVCDKVLDLDPDNKSAILLQSKIFFQWNNYAEALLLINRVIGLTEQTDQTINEIEQHFQKDPNNENILLVEVPEELRELLQFRDQILSKMHTSMTGMYS